MSISTISGLSALTSASNSDSQLSTEQAAAKTLAQLIKDVDSGNVSGAKADLVTLTKQLGANGTGDASSPLGKLLTTLSSDLSSGDLTGAQSAVQSFLTTLKGDATNGAGGHHHHHHASESASTSQDDSTFTPGKTDTTTDGTSQYLATLLQAVQADQGTISSTNAPSGAAAS